MSLDITLKNVNKIVLKEFTLLNKWEQIWKKCVTFIEAL